jgi:hypothetical protein
MRIWIDNGLINENYILSKYRIIYSLLYAAPKLVICGCVYVNVRTCLCTLCVYLCLASVAGGVRVYVCRRMGALLVAYCVCV